MSRMQRLLFKRPVQTDYLEGAKEAAEWVRSLEQRTEHGSYWVEHPKRGPGFAQLDMQHGSAGILLMFLQLADASGDQSYLEDARRGGDFIVHALDTYGIDYLQSSMPSGHYQEGTRDSLISGGGAGVAFALTELNKSVPDASYTRVALSLTETILADAVPAPDGVKWSGKSGINFDAGTVLYLLYAAKEYHHPEWVEVAAAGARAILTTGRKEKVGVQYVGFRNMPRLMLGLDDDDHQVPNFCYGNAGIGLMFAFVYQATGEEAFLTAAKEAAAYMTSIAEVEGDAALTPYRLPDLPEVNYLSLCHGNTGTIRLFYLLYHLTGEDFYREWTRRYANGILATGAPELHSPGYWNCHSICCGTAGFSNLFSALYLKSGEQEYLDAAKRCGFVLLREAHPEERGISWHQAFKRIDPDDITTEPGYYVGAAGIAVALIQLYLAEQGRAPLLRTPDEPFVGRLS